jgi:hypothetical protein
LGGKRLQNVEDAEVVEVGKFYLVKTVIVPKMPKAIQVIPVMGPLHEDAEFVNFPHYHFHPDRRFVPDAWFSYYGWPHKNGTWSPIYSYEINGKDTGMLDGGRRRIKAKRLVDSFRVDAPWLKTLERAYANDKLRDGHICPHRGISCRGVIAENDGVVCPGHGLKWDASTGKLVSRIGQTFQRSLPEVA